MKIYRNILIAAFCLSTLLLHALNFRSYKLNSSNGLNSVFVRSMVQDSTGYMWFATINGLCRYDGYSMKEVICQQNIDQDLVPDNRIINIYLWGKRFLWVKLRGNLFSCYDLKNNKFVDYTGKKSYHKAFRTGYFQNPHEVWLFDRANGCRRVFYDGKSFSYRDLTSQNHLLPSNYVTFIKQGKGNRTWIATTAGLVAYQDGKSKILLSKVSIKGTTILNGIEYFVSDKGAVYTYTKGKMLKLHKSTQDFPIVTGFISIPWQKKLIIATQSDTYEFDTSNNMMKKSALISAKDCHIFTDNQGNDIVYNNRGELTYINHLSQQSHSFTLFGNNTIDFEDLRLHAVTHKHQLWITTYGYGLYIYDLLSHRIERVTPGRSEADLINTNNLRDIYEDARGRLWISQEDLGISCVETLDYPSILIPLNTMETSLTTNVEQNTARMLYLNHTGNLYLANMRSHLFMLQPDLSIKPLSTINDDILTMASDKQGVTWLGTRKQGLFIGGKQYKHDSKNSHSLSCNRVSKLLLDKKGRMWIATFGGGLDLAEPHRDGWHFQHFFNTGGARSETRSLMRDHHGRIWLGTGEGLIVFHPDRLLKNPNDYTQLNVNKNKEMDEVHDIIEDSRHRVWVCISGSGVALYDNMGKLPRLIQHFTTTDGLGENMTQSVIEDTKGKIWVGTNNGISIYDDKSKKFHNHIYSNNPRANICVEGAVCLLRDGKLAFGTKAGLMIVPTMVNANKQLLHKLAITDIYINGIPLSQRTDLAIETSNDVQKLVLSHTQNSLTLYFSDFTFDNMHTSRYSYMLEGYDKGWSTASTLNFTIYKNLPPGHYTFHLRSTDDNSGGITQETRMEFVVQPPIWATWYAILFYIVLACILAYIIYRQIKRVNELHNRVKIEQQLTEYKLQFFTNISHEYRTPLTIIQGAMDRICTTDNIPASLKQPLSAMQKSVKRMMRLINHLLDFRKVQSNKEKLLLEDTEVINFIRDIFYTFRDIAENKQIHYQFMSFDKTYQMYIDRRMVDSIAYNLISNAIKYTPNGGDIDVHISKPDEHHVALTVKDTGIGISKEKQQQLFQRFMQSTFAYDSIGIGLYLSNEFAKLHKGTLSFEENPDGGSIFTLTLPTDKNIYAPQDFAEPATQMIVEAEHDKKKAWLVGYKEIAPEPMNNCRILIVEDDNDVREYLITELQHYFQVESAFNGDEAWKMVKQNRPDLIISDVVMPIMSGYKLTQLVKENDETYDIPVILLTALTDDTKEAKGFEMGADDYIQKPFSVKVLISRCTQLLLQRQRLKNTLSKQQKETQAAPTVIFESRDKKFRETLDIWVNSHIDDPDLNVDTLAQSMGYSRSSFYRKVNKLTGMTPGNYIHSIRMEKAQKLVAETDLTMSEIAYKVGIADPFYFSKTFKDHFGIPPKKYRDSLK